MTTGTPSIKLHGRDKKSSSGFGFAALARALVKRRMISLTGGRLLVRDPWGEWALGESIAPPVILKIRDPQAYVDLLLGGSLGIARAYMEERWTCSNLTELIRLMVRNMTVADSLEVGSARIANTAARVRHTLRGNTKRGSRRNIHDHYDLSNEFFALFLDETMTYSAGIFEHESSTLRDASVAKLDRICRKLRLQPDDHVLEIGSGWGSFAMHAASHYGCRVTTTTISDEQYLLAVRRIREAGLDHRVEVLLRDYRDLTGLYDKLVSIEMIEAVGHAFLPVYFGKASQLLKDDGAMLLQAITMPEQRYDQYLQSSDFIRRYIFPGSCVPSLGAMLEAIGRGSDLKPVHIEDIGPHYATTLRRWYEAFRERETEVQGLGYPRSFVRMWEYYLCYCEAGFAERYLGNVQMLLHKPGCRAEPLLPALTPA